MSCISHDGHCHEENEGNEKEEKKGKGLFNKFFK